MGEGFIKLKGCEMLLSQYKALEAIAGCVNKKIEDFTYLGSETGKEAYYNAVLVYALDNQGCITHLGLNWLGFKAVPEEISKLTELVELRMANNKIPEIENLENLAKLQVLDLHGNQIGRIKNLNLPKLQTMDLHNNYITRLENLDKLPELQYLHLHGNEIKDKERAKEYLKSIGKEKLTVILDGY